MPPDTPPLLDHSPTTYLLPGFDEYLLGYTDRSAGLEPAHASKIVPGNNGMFMPTVVLDGQVAGLWKRTLQKDRLPLTLSPFTSFSPAPGPQLRRRTLAQLCRGSGGGGQLKVQFIM